MASKTRPGVVRSGQGSTKLRDAVIAFYGPICWLQLPGCTKWATTKDHVIPVDHGGTDAMDNLRPACLPCNSKRRNLAISGIGGIMVHVIVGPVAKQLSAHATAHAASGDLVIDIARLTDALTLPVDAPTPKHVEQIATRAYRSAMDAALRLPAHCGVWIVQPVPTAKQLQQYARLRYDIIAIDPGRTTTTELTDSDPRAAREAAAWYKHYPEGAASIERVKAHRAHSMTMSTATSVPAANSQRPPSRNW